MPAISGNWAGIIAIIMWSSANFIITLTVGIPSFMLGFLVMFSGGVIILSWEVSRGKKISEIYRQSIYAYIITLFGIGGYILLNYIAFKIASPFEVNVIDFTWPIFLVLFSAIIHKNKIGIFRLLGILMGFTGMLILFSGSGLGFNSQYWVGYSLSLLGAILFGLYGALTQKVHFTSGFIGLAFVIIGLFSLFLSLLFEEITMPDNYIIWIYILLLAVIRIAYVFWDYALKNGDAIMLASLSYFLPLFSTLIFIIFGQMPLNYWSGIAAILIITGCITVNFKEIQKFIRRDSNDAL